MLSLPARVSLPAPVARLLQSLRLHLPPLNFITIHYAYFIITCLFSAIIFWGSSTPPRSISFTDSLFFTVSAMTLAGLNTVNLSELNTFQQFILFLLIMLGSSILVSSVVVHVRKRAFERKFKYIIEQERRKRKALKSLELNKPLQLNLSKRRASSNIRPEVDGVVVRGRAIPIPQDESLLPEIGNPGNHKDHAPLHTQDGPAENAAVDQENIVENLEAGKGAEKDGEEFPGSPRTTTSQRIRFVPPSSPFSPRQHSQIFSMSGIGARSDLLNHPKRANPASYPIPLAALTEEKGEKLQGTLKYFKSGGFIGRNSQFHNLTLAERDRLGGVEYQAVTLLGFVVLLYFILWQLLGCIGLGAWVAYNSPDIALQNGLNPWWVGAFNGVSAFNNSGMSLLDANMVAFQDSTYMLITMGLMILAGNTCYPIFLRLTLWILLQILPNNLAWREYKVTLRFLLDHPRRCYTTLFPSKHTWWLFAILILLNGIDWIAFEILNIGNDSLASLPTGIRILDGLFQALAVRSGGFYVVNLSQLRIGLLVLYVIMMYISVYPVVITMRNSNVYEERSLGIYASDPDAADGKERKQKPFFGDLKRRLTNQRTEEPRGYFVRQQLRGQLAHDIWWIVLAVLFIVITETEQFEADPVSYSVFNVIFEVVSAYGCVGISVGLPNVAYSFSGGWHVLSKLILCAVMIRGRHRGLPVAIDRAVLLPGEELAAAEEEDAQIRLDRTMSRNNKGL